MAAPDFALPTSIRWDLVYGMLVRRVFDPDTGAFDSEEIELPAKFAFDYGTREQGYGRVESGVYDMRLAPAGSRPPDYPGVGFKTAIGMSLWSPTHGELWWATNSSILGGVIGGLWGRIRSAPELSQGRVPILFFTGCHEHPVRSVGKIFFEPVIDVSRWIERNKILPFAQRPLP